MFEWHKRDGIDELDSYKFFDITKSLIIQTNDLIKIKLKHIWRKNKRKQDNEHAWQHYIIIYNVIII